MIEIAEQVVKDRIEALEKLREEFRQNAQAQVNLKIGEFNGRIHTLRWLLEQNGDEEE